MRASWVFFGRALIDYARFLGIQENGMFCDTIQIDAYTRNNNKILLVFCARYII